ncbi:hypothetical protein ACQY0O_004815 [Thecaphora frezii]
MDARSSDDALPSAPPEPAGAPSTSQPHSPTRDDKQAQVRDLLASLPQAILVVFRTTLQHAFPALKLQNIELDSLSQFTITTCQNNIRPYLEFIVSELSRRGLDSLPDWLARRIFITPSQNRPDIIPADDLFQEYRTWCTLHEEFDFYSALTQLLISGLEAVSDRSTSEGKTFFDDMLISEVDDHLYDEPA